MSFVVMLSCGLCYVDAGVRAIGLFLVYAFYNSRTSADMVYTVIASDMDLK